MPIAGSALRQYPRQGAVAGRLLLGDTDRRTVAARKFAMQACGVVMLALGSTAVVLVAGCILFGLGIGNLSSLPPLIAQKEVSPADVPRIVVLVTAVNQAVFAFAPAILGLLGEAAGGYAFPFLFAATVQVTAAAIVVVGRRQWSASASR